MKPVRLFELFQPVRLLSLESLSFCTVIQDYTVIRDIRVFHGLSVICHFRVKATQDR